MGREIPRRLGGRREQLSDLAVLGRRLEVRQSFRAHRHVGIAYARPFWRTSTKPMDSRILQTSLGLRIGMRPMIQVTVTVCVPTNSGF